MEEAEGDTERNDGGKLAAQACNDIFKVNIVPPVDGKATKALSEFDATQNYQLQISEPCCHVGRGNGN
jgi:hypothetical protein